jgi:hypothetical protein
MSARHRERADVFLRAAHFLHEQGGDASVIRAFGDPAPINEAWELPLEEFKEFLWGRRREALEPERGAA